MPLLKASEYSGGSIFKPADHMTALAILIEPKRIDKNVEHTYQGTTRNRDEVTADISVFSTTEALETGVPTTESKGTRVVHGMLTSTLERMIGEATVVIVTKVPTKGGSGYVFRDPAEDHHAQVEKFYEAREAAITAALNDAPDFE